MFASDFIERYTCRIRQWVTFLSSVLSGDVRYFSAASSHGEVVAKVSMSRSESVVRFAVEIVQNKPRRKLEQTTEQRNLEQTTLHLVATRYSLGIEMTWLIPVHGTFAAALEAIHKIQMCLGNGLPFLARLLN